MNERTTERTNAWRSRVGREGTGADGGRGAAVPRVGVQQLALLPRARGRGGAHRQHPLGHDRGQLAAAAAAGARARAPGTQTRRRQGSFGPS